MPITSVQFTSWAFGDKIRAAGLMPSFGSVGDGLDNAVMETFWSSMQIELLNRRKWKTCIELANAIFDYIEIFYNRQRRHSSLGYRTPIEHELLSEKNPHPRLRLITQGGNQTVGQVNDGRVFVVDACDSAGDWRPEGLSWN